MEDVCLPEWIAGQGTPLAPPYRHRGTLVLGLPNRHDAIVVLPTGDWGGERRGLGVADEAIGKMRSLPHGHCSPVAASAEKVRVQEEGRTQATVGTASRQRRVWNVVSIIRRHFGAVRGDLLSMASFSASIVTKFEAGATFVFGSWLCTANQEGELQHQLRDVVAAPASPHAQTTPRGSRKTLNSDTISGSYPTRRSTWRPKQIQTRADHVNSTPVKRQDQATRPRLPGGLQITSDFRQGSTIRTVTTTPRAPRNSGSDSRGSKTPPRGSRAPQFPFGITNSAAIYQKHLKRKFRQPRRATSDLVMTTTPSGVIVHWPDIDPEVALHEANVPSTVRDILPLLPFQEGRELPVTMSNRKTRPNNPGRQSCVILNDHSDEEVVSDDASTVDGETDADRELRVERNRNRALRRRFIQRKNLNAEFDKEGIFNSPVANIMFGVSVFEGFQATPDINLAKARLEAAAVMVDRLDGGRSASKSKSSSRHQAPSARRQSSHYGSSAGRTKDMARPREEPRRPREEPPRSNRREEPRPAPTSHVADSAGGYDVPNPDALPCYTRTIRVSSFPRKFKPPGITNFDGKQDPNIWLRRYSSAIEASGGDDISKMLYFPVAMEQGPLTWLESLHPDSIDSWHALKKAFVSNYQGSFERPGSKYELRACKQKPDESLRDYNRRFFAIKASCVPIPDSEVIDYFQEGMTDRSLFRDFGHNRPRDLEELRALVSNWMDTDDQERERYGKRSANPGRRNQEDNRDQPRDSFQRNSNNPRKRPTEPKLTFTELDGDIDEFRYPHGAQYNVVRTDAKLQCSVGTAKPSGRSAAAGAPAGRVCGVEGEGSAIFPLTWAPVDRASLQITLQPASAAAHISAHRSAPRVDSTLAGLAYLSGPKLGRRFCLQTVG
nr:unnamed protein product [Digitaria exilis]